MDNKELNKKIFEAVYSIAKDEFKRIEIVPGAYSLDQVLKLGISPDDGTEKIVQIGDYRLNFPVKSVFVVLDRLKSLPGTPKKIQFIKEDEADNVVCSFFIEVEKDHKDVCSPLLKGKNDKDVCKHVYINPIKGIIIGTNGYTIIDKLTHITGIKGNTESANIYISPKDFKKLRGRVFVEHMEKRIFAVIRDLLMNPGTFILVTFQIITLIPGSR